MGRNHHGLRLHCSGGGYKPDSTVCASEVPAGRPYPHMCLQNAINLNVTTVTACIKVDDTVPGIEEDLNAGMWSIGLAISGNEVGLSLEDWKVLPKAEQDAKRRRAYMRMHQCGAHYVIDSIADLMPCIDEIQTLIRSGKTP
ncbi:MAG: HAD-IA family hydrolase [Vulcanimicrobiaceae bacterium]